METMALRVDKAAFPSLVAKMWDRVVKPEHLIGGFRAAGLHPLSRDAIPPTKLKTSAPFRNVTSASASPQRSQPHSQPPPTVSETPVFIHIAQFFGSLFLSKATNVTIGVRRKGRTEPRHYGEALTEDDVLERIREQEEKKKEKAAEKAAKKGRRKQKSKPPTKRGKQAAGRHRAVPTEDENICQECGGHYEDDDEESQEAWIGCDERGCWRWYHYWCVGHLDMPDPKLKWICPACKEET